MEENIQIEKKSIKIFERQNPDWDELAKDCISFANAYGGHIYIGIEDNENLPNPYQKIPLDIIPKIIKKIQNLTLNVAITANIIQATNKGEFIDLFVKRTSSTIASTTNGRYYIRVEDECKPVLPDEISRLFNDKQSFVWEMQQYLKISRNDYDKNKLSLFINDIKSSDRVSSFVKEKNVDEIIDYYYFAIGDFLTNLGVLWIGKREHRAKLLYSPSVQFIKYDELEQKVKKILWDDFSLNPKELIESIWQNIPDFQEALEFPDGVFRKKVFNYDEIVVRELIANALVHKPYTTRGDVFINLYIDRIEIHNPGLLPIGVTPKNILHMSIQRNQHLAKVFYDLKLMEKEGSGFDKMYEVLLSAGKQVPIIIEENDRVIVKVHKNIINKAVINFIDNVNQEINLKSKELIALGLIAQYNSLSIKELSNIIGLEDNKIKSDWISRLIKLKLINKKGKTKGVTYFIPNDLLNKLNFKGITNLKNIESYRLRELIREDLKKYPNSSRNDIHQRIGEEIPARTIRNEIMKLVQNGEIIRLGKNKSMKYSLYNNN